MRIDKFLKIAMIFKTRSFGEKLIESSKVHINGKPCKPAATVKVGDLITIETPFKRSTYKINELAERSVPRNKASELTTLIGEEQID